METVNFSAGLSHYGFEFIHVRFHLGSGINGNEKNNLRLAVEGFSPLSSRKWN